MKKVINNTNEAKELTIKKLRYPIKNNTRFNVVIKKFVNKIDFVL